MRSFQLISVLLFSFYMQVSAQRDTLLPAGNLCSSGHWELVFSDEFDGLALDPQKWISWFPYSNDGTDQCEFCRTHGNEGQIYSDDNIKESEGTLKLIAKRETKKWFNAERQYSSGMIHSKKEFGFGRYEIRCKLPIGMGFWPAFWMFGNKATELDVFEIGTQKSHRNHVGIISWPINQKLDFGYNGNKSLTEGFHTFAMEWDTNFIRFEVDSSEVWRISKFITKRGRTIKRCDIKAGKYRIQPVYPLKDEKLSIIANVAVGTENTPFTHSPDANTVFPNQMEIDWIRVYQRK
jgi:beta-glucanase (GH16 family)